MQPAAQTTARTAANAARVPVLALDKVSRSFGPVQVLFDVDFDLYPGEVHALIGENGAGKSTMMKILSGYLEPTSGKVTLDGAPASFASSEDAEDRGVVLIHQEFNLADQLSVEQNIFLGREIKRGLFLDHKAMRTVTNELLKRLETKTPAWATVSKISVPEKQMVEIAKALSREARVLIMDEPTAVLTRKEAEILFRQIERLKAQGTAILYTSHKLDEVARIADRVTVLRDGRRVLTAPASGLSEDAMAEAMVGRELSNLFPDKTPASAAGPVLCVKDFSVPGIVDNASFELRRGEILGFAGLVGSGRTELMEGLIGIRPASGEIRVNGKARPIRSVDDARKAGIAYLTEDRKEELFRQAAMARAFGVEIEEISPAEVGEYYPHVNLDGVTAGVYLPKDGQGDPGNIALSLVRGATKRGAKIYSRTKVTGMRKQGSRITGVSWQTEDGDQGEIACDMVVNCAGMWARDVGKMAGVNVPLHACEHYYIVTDNVPDLGNLPVLRVPDECAYYKEDAGKILLGMFEPKAKPWGMNGIPDSFEFDELPPDFEHFEPILEMAINRLPLLGQTGIHTFFNGPESFTPDDAYHLGLAPGMENVWVAAGFNSVGIQSAVRNRLTWAMSISPACSHFRAIKPI